MRIVRPHVLFFFFFQAEDGIRDLTVTGVQCALPISLRLCPLPSSVPAESNSAAPMGMPPSASPARASSAARSEERREGKSVDLGGRRIIKKKRRWREVSGDRERDERIEADSISTTFE